MKCKQYIIFRKETNFHESAVFRLFRKCWSFNFFAPSTLVPLSDEEKKNLHYHDDEDALVCGDRFDDTMAPENEPSNNQNEVSQESNNKMSGDSLNGRGLTENEKKDIKYGKAAFASFLYHSF